MYVVWSLLTVVCGAADIFPSNPVVHLIDSGRDVFVGHSTNAVVVIRYSYELRVYFDLCGQMQLRNI